VGLFAAVPRLIRTPCARRETGLAYVRSVATVLVVDDDALSREFMCTLLSYRGHQIQQASDGDSALTLIAQHPPDAVITDVLMPGLDGYGLARAMRSKPTTKHIPIVFNTAHYGPDEIRPLADAYNVHDVIFKPAHPTTVLATIDALPIPGQASELPTDHAAEIQRLTRSGTWQPDPATSTIVVSPPLRHLLLLPSTTVTLAELTRHVHPDDLAGITTTAENTWRTGSPGTAEIRVTDPDGAVHELIVSCWTTPAHGSATGSQALWGVAQDVTQIRDDLRTHLQVQTDWHAVRRTIDAFHRAVLPQMLPAVAGVELAAVYLPAPHRLDIGAAWYDALRVDRNRIILSVGKIAGHDRHPAAVMGHVLAALRAYAHDHPEPAGVLTRLNRYLTDTGEDDTFVTAVVALFDPDTGRLRVANGGNPAPLILTHARDGDARAALLTSAGPALSVVANAAFDEIDFHLAPGEAFCAYTDGLIDRHSDPTSADRQNLPRIAARAFGQHTGEDPHPPALAQLFAESVVGDMLDGTTPDDDICLAVLRSSADGT
jgi:serine phosphatase RsbU (regulator of sigma subunit)/CheY-like chemotaxis protein